jgi:hypothetical protein
MDSGDSSKSKQGWCRWWVVAVLVVAAVCIGILVWQLLPEESKSNIQEITNITIHVKDETLSPTSAPTAPATSNTFNRCTPEEVDSGDCCNGVGGNFCDLPVTNVTFATVHNAMSSKEDGFFVAWNHDTPLEGALDAGYRGINLDIAVCDGKYLLIHGFCALGSRDPAKVFSNINSFLDDNPNEVILILLQIVNDADEPVDLQGVYDILSAVDGFTDKLYVHSPGSDWPTLRTLIQSDQRVLLFHFNGPSCADESCPRGLQEWFAYADETVFEFANVTDVQNTDKACQVTRGSGTGDFLGISVFLEIPDKDASIILNEKSFLENQLKACSQANANRLVNVFMVDFWHEGDAVEVAQSVNEAAAM